MSEYAFSSSYGDLLYFLAACEQPSMKQDTVFTYPDTEQDPVWMSTSVPKLRSIAG